MTAYQVTNNIRLNGRRPVLRAAALILLAVGVASAAAAAPAEDEDNPHVWKPRIRAVAVFKNGLGFFMREGDVKLRDGWCVAQQIPPATFGTLAIYARNVKENVDVVGSGPGEVVEFDGRDASKDPAAKRARLEACKDLKVQLQYKHKGQDRTASGKLVSVGPEFVVLESDSNSFAVPTDGVTHVCRCSNCRCGSTCKVRATGSPKPRSSAWPICGKASPGCPTTV